MKSKLTIDLAEDNQPIIRIEYNPSEDVRDKMVKRFLETFGGASCWARFQYIDWAYAPDNPILNRVAELRPLSPDQLQENGKEMSNMGDYYVENQTVVKTI